MYTVATLKLKIKRRLRDIRATTSPSTETESGNRHSDNAILDAINAGRQKIVETFKSSDIWSRQIAVFQTSESCQDYGLDTIIHKVFSVQVDTESDGRRKATTVDALPVYSSREEQMLIDDPSYTPSITEPYYRLRNRAIRLIVSSTGAVTASKYVAVEIEGDMETLSSDEEASYLTDALDELCIEWALRILTETTDPAASAKFEQSFYNHAAIIERQGVRQ